MTYNDYKKVSGILYDLSHLTISNKIKWIKVDDNRFHTENNNITIIIDSGKLIMENISYDINIFKSYSRLIMAINYNVNHNQNGIDIIYTKFKGELK